MKIDLTGQVAVITGAYGAIGMAMCEKFAGAGAAVVVSGRNREKGAAFAQELREKGAKAIFIYGDVAEKQCMEDLCAESIAKFGRIDILVNNAGVNVGTEGRVAIQDFDDENWHSIIDIDLTGLYYCSKPVIKHMIERKYGRVINISSIVGLVPLRNQCAFAAAKAGVVNLTKAMAIELAPHNILVNCICPGSIINDKLRDIFYSNKEVADRLLSHVPLGRPGEPEEIAGATVFLASKEAGYMTGGILTIDGGWTCGFARDF